MKKNMGSLDRIARIVIAAVLIALYLTGTIPGLTGIIVAALAVIFLITSILGVCPLYLPFGLDTLRKKTHTQRNG